MNKTRRSERWQTIYRWVWIAKKQKDVEAGNLLFIQLLRKISPLFSKKERKYILSHFQEYRKAMEQ